MNLAQKLTVSTAAVVIGLLALVPDVGKAGQKRSNHKRNERLIEEGRQLFMNETFDGNGRTCATCHPPTNNFTIDPDFIATLPDDDPLFVAEFNPDLAELENPRLMREFGLILENLNGFDEPPVFRSVPHTLGMSRTIEPVPGETAVPGEQGLAFRHATGWSGDGAPLNPDIEGADGSLRAFLIGAIIQHFPKTLNRVPGQDFRLPTERELDAIEAFTLSLGRQEEVDLSSMIFADPTAELGKQLFVNDDGSGKPLLNRACSECHENAGANNADGHNQLINAGAGLVTPDEEAGFDGGFGFPDQGLMNTPSLIEAADTPPFFHNNVAPTLEDATRFYTTDIFAGSRSGQDGGPFELTEDDILAIGAFLRALNALENMRNVGVLARQAQRQSKKRARETIDVVIADTEDAIHVLNEMDLYPDAVERLDHALAQAEAARAARSTRARNAALRQVGNLMEKIPDLILAPPDQEVAEVDLEDDKHGRGKRAAKRTKADRDGAQKNRRR